MALPQAYDWNRIRAALWQLEKTCEFCRELEAADSLNASRWVARARAVKTSTLDFFSRDARFFKRLQAGISRLNPATHKAIVQWAKHHLPGTTK